MLSNDTDVDNGATRTVSAVRSGSEAGSGTVGTLGSALAGAYGSLTLNANGSYSYAVDNGNTTVNALNASQSLTDSFTYTVSDGNGGFDQAQLVYEELLPLEPGFHELRSSLYNLYPRLVHVRLFGASYLAGIEATLAQL